ncbi:MAG: choice-of-anchor D domain-containing protein, partial [Pirellulales bacterium]
GELLIPADNFSENPFGIRLIGDVLSPPPAGAIDDGNTGFSSTGTFVVDNGSGFLGDHRNSTATGDTASWTFNGIAPGRQYRLTATWIDGGDRETAAPYSTTGFLGAPTVTVDQQQPPAADLVLLGTDFQELGIFTADGSGTVVVTLTDTVAMGVVTADAVRLQEVRIINNEDPAPHYAQVGMLNFDDQGRLGSVDATHPPIAGDMATFTFTGLADGLYRVSTTWTPFQLRATDAPYTLSGIAGGDRTIEINQKQAPDDFTFDGTLWEDLDTVGVVGGTLTVRLNSSLTGDVVADAVRIDRLPFQPEIELIDLGTDEAPGGGDDQLLFDGQSTVDFGTVNNGGTATRTFEVHNRGDVDLTLGQLRLPVVFNLLGSPATPIAAGGMTTFQVEFAPPRVDTFSGELRLANNDSNENPFSVTLIGEAVPVIAIIDNFMEAGYSEPGGPIARWTGQGFAGGDGVKDVSEALPGGAAQTAVWTFNGLSDNTTYRVSATWTAYSNRATDAPYTIGGIDGPDVTFDINQKLAPNDFTESGVNWEDLAIVRTDGTTLTITLTDLADGNVIADAIRIEELPAHGPEIQLSASGFDVPDGPGSISLSGTVGSAVSQTIDVVNMGTDMLTLSDASLLASLATIPGFSSPGFGSMTLAPGAATTFDVVLDTSVIGSFGGT